MLDPACVCQHGAFWALSMILLVCKQKVVFKENQEFTHESKHRDVPKQTEVGNRSILVGTVAYFALTRLDVVQKSAFRIDFVFRALFGSVVVREDFR